LLHVMTATVFCDQLDNLCVSTGCWQEFAEDL
jgi:hypothetical protein